MNDGSNDPPKKWDENVMHVNVHFFLSLSLFTGLSRFCESQIGQTAPALTEPCRLRSVEQSVCYCWCEALLIGLTAAAQKPNPMGTCWCPAVSDLRCRESKAADHKAILHTSSGLIVHLVPLLYMTVELLSNQISTSLFCRVL